MEKKSKKKSQPHIQDTVAAMMYTDISGLINEYTHDSIEPKFFLPEPLIDHCRTIAAAFAAELFTPPLEDKRVFETEQYSTYLLTTIFGSQLFIKERSIAKHRAPYLVETNIQKIHEAKKKALESLKNKEKISFPVEQVMNTLVAKLKQVKKKEKKGTKKPFSKKNFELYLYTTLLWGYFFAREMIHDEK